MNCKMKNNQGILVKKSENWYNLYINSIGVGSTHKELQGYKLSITNCNKITKGYDLDELVEDNFKGLRDCISDSDIAEFYISLVKTTVTEILGDKKFSEEDIKRAMDVTLNYEIKRDAKSFQEKIDFLKSLQQTEWKVELVTETVNGINMHVFESPRFDADGCVILKLID